MYLTVNTRHIADMRTIHFAEFTFVKKKARGGDRAGCSGWHGPAGVLAPRPTQLLKFLTYKKE